MRYVDPSMRARLLTAQQTLYKNADPRAIVRLSRPTTALTNATFLERQIIDFANVTAVSVAVRHKMHGTDRLYIGYISGGEMRVISAQASPAMSQHVWIDEGERMPATACALAFDGTMPKNRYGKIEFVTEDKPWIFWISGGALYAKHNGVTETLATENATAVTAVRAMWSDVGGFDFGLCVFFILSGAIYYRQYIDGAWLDAVPVSFGPSVTWAEITATRTWDYRVALQCKDTTGAIYELYTEFMGVAKQNTEHIDILDISAVGELIKVHYIDTAADEHINIAAISASGALIYGLSSVAKSARNIADGTNWGALAEITFDHPLHDVAGNAPKFTLTDSAGTVFQGESIALSEDGLTLTVGFTDFNGAVGNVTIAYAGGTIQSPAVALADFTIAFTPQNLVPPVKDPATVTGITNADTSTIAISFTDAISCATLPALASAITVTGSEYDYVPGGTIAAKQYAVSAASITGNTLTLTLANRMRAPVGNVTVAYNGTGGLTSPGGQVVAFADPFVPTIPAPLNNPNDPEHINIANITASGALTKINYANTATDSHVNIANITATGTLKHINDI